MAPQLTGGVSPALTAVLQATEGDVFAAFNWRPNWATEPQLHREEMLREVAEGEQREPEPTSTLPAAADLWREEQQLADVLTMLRKVSEGDEPISVIEKVLGKEEAAAFGELVTMASERGEFTDEMRATMLALLEGKMEGKMKRPDQRDSHATQEREDDRSPPGWAPIKEGQEE